MIVEIYNSNLFAKNSEIPKTCHNKSIMGKPRLSSGPGHMPPYTFQSDIKVLQKISKHHYMIRATVVFHFPI